MKKNLVYLLSLLAVISVNGQSLNRMVGKDAVRYKPGQNSTIGPSQEQIYGLLNKKLPDFNLKDLNGKTFNSSQLIGKPSIINLWSVHCSPCIQEFVFLDSLKSKYGDKLNYIAIGENSAEEIKKVLQKKPFTFYILQEGYYYQNNTLKAKSLPKILWLDKNGIIRMIQNGLPLEKDPKTGKLIISKSTPFEEIVAMIIG